MYQRLVLTTLIALQGATVFGQNPNVELESIAVAEVPRRASPPPPDFQVTVFGYVGNNLSFNKKGYLAAAGEQEVLIIKDWTQSPVKIPGDFHSIGIDWSPDGTVLAYGGKDGRVMVVTEDGKRLFDARLKTTALKRSRLDAGIASVHFVRWFGDHLVACEVGAHIQVVHWPTRTRVLQWDPLPIAPQVYDLKLAKDGTIEEMLVTAQGGTFRVFPDRPRTWVEYPGRPETWFLDRRGQVELQRSGDSLAVLRSGKETIHFKTEGGHAALNADGNRILLRNYEGVRVLSLQGEEVFDVAMKNPTFAVLSPDGTQLAVSDGRVVKVWLLPKP